MVVYKVAVLRSFAKDGDTLEVVMGRGQRVDGGVLLGDKLCWDKDWHESEVSAKCEAANRLEEIAKSIADQAKGLREDA